MPEIPFHFLTIPANTIRTNIETCAILYSQYPLLSSLLSFLDALIIQTLCINHVKEAPLDSSIHLHEHIAKVYIKLTLV